MGKRKGNGLSWTAEDLQKIQQRNTTAVAVPAEPKLTKQKKLKKPPTKEYLAFCKRLKDVLVCNNVESKLVAEHRFNPNRKWRFDFAYPELKIGIEYEGIGKGLSGHTTPRGYSDDCLKYNWAAVNGWTVLRYTAMTYEHLLLDLSQIQLNGKFREMSRLEPDDRNLVDHGHRTKREESGSC